MAELKSLYRDIVKRHHPKPVEAIGEHTQRPSRSKSTLNPPEACQVSLSSVTWRSSRPRRWKYNGARGGARGTPTLNFQVTAHRPETGALVHLEEEQTPWTVAYSAP